MNNDNILFFLSKIKLRPKAENESIQIHKRFNQAFRKMLKVDCYGKFKFSINNPQLNHMIIFIFHQCHMGSPITHTLYEQLKRRFFLTNIYRRIYA